MRLLILGNFIVAKTRFYRFGENAARYQLLPHIASFLTTRKMPVKRRVNFIVGWAGEPAIKRFVENATRYQFNRTLNLRLRL
jgi:hypothetical protein